MHSATSGVSARRRRIPRNRHPGSRRRSSQRAGGFQPHRAEPRGRACARPCVGTAGAGGEHRVVSTFDKLRMSGTRDNAARVRATVLLTAHEGTVTSALETLGAHDNKAAWAADKAAHAATTQAFVASLIGGILALLGGIAFVLFALRLVSRIAERETKLQDQANATSAMILQVALRRPCSVAWRTSCDRLRGSRLQRRPSRARRLRRRRRRSRSWPRRRRRLRTTRAPCGRSRADRRHDARHAGEGRDDRRAVALARRALAEDRRDPRADQRDRRADEPAGAERRDRGRARRRCRQGLRGRRRRGAQAGRALDPLDRVDPGDHRRASRTRRTRRSWRPSRGRGRRARSAS